MTEVEHKGTTNVNSVRVWFCTHYTLWASALLISIICLIASITLLPWSLPRTQTFSLANLDQSIARGFHSSEVTETGRGFRWTDGNSRLWLSAQGIGHHTLQFTATAPPPVAAPASVELVLDNQFFTNLSVTRDIRQYHLLVPAQRIQHDGNVVGILSSSYTVQSERTPRNLGIVLFEVTWESLRGSLWLASIQVLVIGVACTAFLQIARQTGVSFIVGGLATFMFAVLLFGWGHVEWTFTERWNALLLTCYASGLLFVTAAALKVFPALLSFMQTRLHRNVLLARAIIYIFLAIILLVGSSGLLVVAAYRDAPTLPLLLTLIFTALFVGVASADRGANVLLKPYIHITGRIKVVFYVICILLMALLNCQPILESHLPAHRMRPCQPDFFLSHDGHLYAQVADQPELLLASESPGSLLQSRPAYIFIAAIISQIAESFYVSINFDITRIGGYVSEMTAFVIMNFILLLGALLLFDRLLVPIRHFCLVVVLLMLFLLFSDVAMDNIWYLHVQMFNILSPLILIACSYGILRYPALFSKYLIPICLLMGFLIMFYGSFVLLLPVSVLSYFIAWWFHRQTQVFQRSLLQLTGELVLMLILIPLPYVSWIFIVYTVTGGYYNREVRDFNQFVWTIQALQEGGVIQLVNAITQDTLPGFFTVLARTAWKHLVLLVGAAGVFIAVGASRENITLRHKVLISAILICLSIIIPFFYFQKYYADRLIFNVVPPLILLSGVFLLAALPYTTRWQRWLIYGTLLLLATEPFYLG